ncbi:MAG: tubulin-like doman-containing protein [Myxococcota bacterium]|nr:tubulin-like doman-containing protein [Myxococcota bacterium]
MSQYRTGGKLSRFNDAEDRDALQRYVESAEHGRYPRTLLIGLGGTGAKALQHLREMKVQRFGRVDLPGVAYLSLDTDLQSARPEATSEQSPYEDLVSFDETQRINLSADLNVVLHNMARHPHIKEWWDDTALDSSRNFDLSKGAGQIRPLSRLVFFQNRALIQSALERCWSEITAQNLDDGRLQKGKVRVVVVAGLAGGTGSGMFLDLAALIRASFAGREFDLEGIFVLPGVYKGADTKFPKLAANGYAALREINHYLSHRFQVQWDHQARADAAPLYNRYVLLSGTNALAESMADPADAYRVIGEQLFLDFAGGRMKSWVEGVRVNREQYLSSFVGYDYVVEGADGKPRETHAEQYQTAFVSFGLSKLVYPSWRLLNYAKFDLAAEMVRLLDPGHGGQLGDVLTGWRTRFMVECGFYQGTLVDEDGSRSRVYQVRDALAQQKGTRTSASTIFEHIQELGDELVSLSEEMFHEKSTEELAKEHFRHVRKLFGDPYSAGNEGDWALQITKNREAYLRAVRGRLPDVVETFRRRRGVGITGVREILQSILEELERPWDKALFIDWLRHMRTEKQREAEEAKTEWERLLRNTHQASKGLLPSADNHHAALEMASEAFVRHWRARVTEYICAEGVDALEGVRKLIREQLTRIDGIVAHMQELEGWYANFRDHFADPVPSTLFIEVPLQDSLQGLLEPYLGADAGQRRERLEKLLAGALRRMGIDTLSDLEARLGGERDRFRDQLAAESFFALKGDETGRTAAFVGEDSEPQPGFLHRYSLLAALEQMPWSEVQVLLKQLYDKGLPWIEPTPKDPTGGATLEPVADAFLGLSTLEGRFVDQLFSAFKACQPHKLPFRPQKVGTNDPSELVFFTEWSAFAAYYIGEVHGAGGMEAHYERMLYDPVRPAALHIHTDFHTFQDMVPLEEQEVRWTERAWKLFTQAQMLGLICSRRRRHGDDERVSFTRRRRSTALDVAWEELGVEATVLRNLSADRGFVQQLTADIERRIQDLMDAGGDYGDLVCLADYWLYCVYPVVNVTEQSGASVVQARGSLENLAVSEIRKEWIQMALAAGIAPEQLIARRIQRMGSLSEWTQPIYKSPGLPVPGSADVPDELRVDEWGLLPQVREQIDRMTRMGALRQSRDEMGRLALQFPRLALNWGAFKPPHDLPEFEESATTYWYAGPQGKEQGLSAEQIAERVVAAPSARHRVFATGWSGWKDAAELSAVKQALSAGPPPDDGGQPDLVDAGSSFHYACDGERKGVQTAQFIADAASSSPDSVHKVWTREFGRAWKLAAEVPEIAERMGPPPLDDEPPPLDDDEPPPLD